MADPHPSDVTAVRASLVLFAAAVVALIAANSPLSGAFKGFWATPVTVGIGPYVISDSLKLWIKNGLMAVFFLQVGLEIKNEFMEGALADRKRAMLPILAAAGGIVVPALIYLAIVAGDRALVRGWAIPTATDIAFAIGVVGLLGSRVPPALKAFLLAVAVIDDLAAILVIAVFYSADLAPVALGIALAAVLALKVLRFFRVSSAWPYLAIGVLLWIAIYHGGMSPTLAGVIVAAFIPLKDDAGGSPLHRLEQALRLPVLFFIMPVFALANAGVAMGGGGTLSSLLTVAIAAALIVGKPIGIVAAVFASNRVGVAAMPEGATWRQICGAGALAGIGFTMSLFTGYLAFGDGPVMDQVRVGVLLGSLVSGLAGAALLWRR